MSLITQYPWWYLLACPLAGLLYAFVLYSRSNDFNRSIKRGLFLLRFILVSLFFLLLFDPFLHHTKATYHKPALAVLIDNSASMVQSADSQLVRTLVPGLSHFLEEKLSNDYEVVTWQFDGDAFPQKSVSSLDFKGTQTALGNALSELNQRFLSGELAGVVLVTDGINTIGKDPIGVAQTFQVPIFTLATGDTGVLTDLALRQIFYNRETFAGNNFPLEINIKANGAAGKKSHIEVLFDNHVVWKQEVSIINNNQSFTFTPLIHAPREGILRYSIRVQAIKDEANLKNNATTIFIDARKKPTRILLLSEGPHPDVGALHEIFKESEMFDVVWVSMDEWNSTINDYDLVVFIGLPTAQYGIDNLLEDVQKQQKPSLFILGSKTDVSRFNKLNCSISISSPTGKTSSFYSSFNNGFGLFKISNRIIDKMGILPPLTGPEGVYEARPGTEVLFYQKISGVETPYPLVAFSRNGQRTQGFICGEGLWWWRNILYKELDSHQEFKELMTSIILYLASGAEKGNFRVKAPQRLKQGEHAYFVAELLNPSFQRINEPDVHLKMKDGQGNEYPFLFSRRESDYALDAGLLEPGIWKWEASTSYAGKNYTSSGMFVVEENLAEMFNLTADHLLLSRLSAITQGKMIYLNQMEQLPELIKQKAPPFVQVFEDESFRSVFDLWPFMVILFLLAAAEWGIRKYHGIL